MPDTKAEIQVVARAAAASRSTLKSIAEVEQAAFAEYGPLATLSDFIEDDAAGALSPDLSTNKTRGTHRRSRSRTNRNRMSQSDIANYSGGRGSARAIVATLSAYQQNSLNSAISEEWSGEGTRILEILTKEGILGLERTFMQVCVTQHQVQECFLYISVNVSCSDCVFSLSCDSLMFSSSPHRPLATAWRCPPS